MSSKPALGREAGYLDADYAAKGAKILPTRADVFGAADIVIQVLCYGSNDRTGKADVPLYRPNQALIGFLRPLGSARNPSRDRLERRDRFFDRIDAAHHARAKHGRAFLDGHHQRLQSGRDRRGHAPQDFSHAHYRGGNDHSRPRFYHGMRRCRAASHRHRAQTWSGRLCVRPASRG